MHLKAKILGFENNVHQSPQYMSPNENTERANEFLPWYNQLVNGHPPTHGSPAPHAPSCSSAEPTKPPI